MAQLLLLLALFLPSPRGAPRSGLDWGYATLDKSSMVAKATVEHGGQDKSSPCPRGRYLFGNLIKP